MPTETFDGPDAATWTPPAGVTSAVVTVRAKGADGRLTFFPPGKQGGGSGACSQSTVAVSSTNTYDLGDFGESLTAISLDGEPLVSAENAALSVGGLAANGLGDVKFSGANGGFASANSVGGPGGAGSAGTEGDGAAGQNAPLGGHGLGGAGGAGGGSAGGEGGDGITAGQPGAGPGAGGGGPGNFSLPGVGHPWRITITYTIPPPYVVQRTITPAARVRTATLIAPVRTFTPAGRIRTATVAAPVRIVVPARIRTVNITETRTMYQAGPKAPGDIDRFHWNWAALLVGAETVSSFTAVVAQGSVAVDSTALASSVGTAVISGGEAGEVAIVRGRAVLSSGRQLDVSIWFYVVIPKTVIDPKDPDDIDDFTWNFGNLLASGETISTFTVAIDAGGVTVSGVPSNTTTTGTARLIAGTTGSTAQARARITTSLSRRLDWIAEFAVQAI